MILVETLEKYDDLFEFVGRGRKLVTTENPTGDKAHFYVTSVLDYRAETWTILRSP